MSDDRKSRVKRFLGVSRVKRFLGVDVTTGEFLTAGYRYWAWLGALVLLIIGGLVAWAFQASYGLIITGQRDTFIWGLYIQGYLYFVGLSAGGLVIYASVELFGAKQFKPLARIAVLQAMVCCLMAIICIVSDLETPGRIIWFLRTPNFASPFIYTGSGVTIYLALTVIDLWVLTKVKKVSQNTALTLTLIALTVAIYLHSTTAWVLSMERARELWHAAIMVPIFLSSAMVSGVGLLILIAYFFQRITRMRFPQRMFYSMSTLLATLIAVDMFLLFIEVLSVLWPTSASPGHVIRLMLFITGRYAPIFIPEVLIFGIVPFFMLAIRKFRKNPVMQIAASIMVVIGILMKRFVLLAMGFGLSPIGPFKVNYSPGLAEIMIILAICAVGALVFSLALKLLPLEELE